MMPQQHVPLQLSTFWWLLKGKVKEQGENECLNKSKHLDETAMLTISGIKINIYPDSQ